MKMNWVEKILMNNPVRSAILRRYETPLLLKIGGLVPGKYVLEVGCGSGVGTDLIFKMFGAGKVASIDLDPLMVFKARKRLTDYSSEKLTVTVGDVAKINFSDKSFDAVFDFAMIHHVEDWQKAISEIWRVLKPGGKFYFEEVTKQGLNKWFLKLFTDHPKKDRFSSSEFVAELEKNGFIVGNNWLEKRQGDFVFGVGVKL